MSSNYHSFLCTNPTHEHLLETAQAILRNVQNGVRSRKVKPPKDLLIVFSKPEGLLQWNGGLPGKASGGYTGGQTSRFGVVWWTDRNNNRHVRVTADRTQASNFCVQEIYESVTHPFCQVFTDKPILCRKCGYEIPFGEGHWDGCSDGFVCDTCVEGERYLRDTGFLPPGLRRKK